MASGLSTRGATALLAGVVLAWGTNWPVTKLIVQDVPPLWATALRCMVAAAMLAPMLWAQGQFVVPKRGDLPVVFCTALLHLVAFSALVAAALQFVPAGRAIVLGYTTPLWVAIGAAMLLSVGSSRPLVSRVPASRAADRIPASISRSPAVRSRALEIGRASCRERV